MAAVATRKSDAGLQRESHTRTLDQALEILHDTLLEVACAVS